MKLFTVGPVEMYPETLDIAGKQLPYFRTAEFSEIMFENERLIKKAVYAGDDAKAAFLTTSGTGAMEAAVINCFTSRDRVLIINGGGFGRRFCEICERHGIAFDSVDLKFGEVLTKDRLPECGSNEADLPKTGIAKENFEKKNSKYTGLLVNIDETSTGQLYDIKMLSEYCKENDMYFIVDAISSFGADEIKFDEYGIDVLIIGSQKALALSPGIAITVMSESIIKNRIEKITCPCYYLDLRDHLKNMERGQTPFTPAVGILLELNQRLQYIDSVGIEKIIADTKELADYFREKARAIGIKIPEYPLSNAVTPILFDCGAGHIFETLKNEHGIFITPSGGELADKLLRVGHIGNLKKEDYDELLIKIEELV